MLFTLKISILNEVRDFFHLTVYYILRAMQDFQPILAGIIEDTFYIGRDLMNDDII